LFSVTDGAFLSASSNSGGNSGNITITARDVQLDGTGSDNVGGVYSQILSRGTGQGGNIVVTAESLALTNGATLTTDIAGQGRGGEVRVTASNEVRVSGAADSNSLSRLSARTLGNGNAGSISITTGSLIIEGGGQVLTVSDEIDGGNAGDITISATNQVRVSGESLLGRFPNGELLSRLTTRTRGAGNAGNLSIATERLVIEGGAQVATANNFRTATGDAGTLTINADRIDIRGASAIESGSGDLLSRLVTRTDGLGNAGDLRITTRVLNIEDGAQVSSGTNNETSTGNGGLLLVRAFDQVRVRGTSLDRRNVSRLTARTDGTGGAGTLVINTGRLLVEAGGQVSAGSLNRGQGGTLTINADREVRVSGSIIQPPSETSPRGDEVSSRIATRAEGSGSAGNWSCFRDVAR
jgi:large exoprotein involved in heme utilization and adhesion